MKTNNPGVWAMLFMVALNTTDATKKHLDDCLLSIAGLEQRIGAIIPVADYAKHDKPSSSWLVPHQCNKS